MGRFLFINFFWKLSTWCFAVRRSWSPPGAQPHRSEHGTFFCSFFYSFWKPSTTSGKVFLFGFVFELWSVRILSRTLNCVSVSFVVNFQIPSGGSSSTADQYLGGLTKEWTRLWEKNTIWLKKKCVWRMCKSKRMCKTMISFPLHSLVQHLRKTGWRSSRSCCVWLVLFCQEWWRLNHKGVRHR